MLITKPKTSQSGLTLIEMLIAVVILGILTAVAVPNFRIWMQNAQVRTAAEAITNGLQKARAEAVSRNTNVEFILAADSAWTIRQAGGATIESRPGSEGSKDVTITTIPAAATITFNNFGGVVTNADGSAQLAQIDFEASGADRPLRVNIGVGGNARMCDPNLSAGSSAC